MLSECDGVGKFPKHISKTICLINVLRGRQDVHSVQVWVSPLLS